MTTWEVDFLNRRTMEHKVVRVEAYSYYHARAVGREKVEAEDATGLYELCQCIPFYSR